MPTSSKFISNIKAQTQAFSIENPLKITITTSWISFPFVSHAKRVPSPSPPSNGRFLTQTTFLPLPHILTEDYQNAVHHNAQTHS